MFNKSRTLILLAGIFFSSMANADLAIIAHPQYAGGELDSETVKKLFLGERSSFPSGHKAIPANHSAGSPDRKHFFEYVLGMGELRHKRYWSRKVATGKEGSPLELRSHAEVLNWVANTPLGIAYIDKSMVNDSVKVVLTVDIFEDI